MRERYGFLVIFWTMLLSLVLFAPQPGYAQITTTTTGAAGPAMIPGPPPVDSALCPGVAEGTNTLDNAARNNTIAQGQALFTSIMNLSTLFPVKSAINQCLNTIMAAMAALPNLANPNGFATIIAGFAATIIAGLIGQVCAQVMAEVNAIKQDITNLAKICIPLPNLGGLSLPRFNLAGGCTGGGLQLNLINGWTAQSRPAQYNYNQYLK